MLISQLLIYEYDNFWISKWFCWIFVKSWKMTHFLKESGIKPIYHIGLVFIIPRTICPSVDKSIRWMEWNRVSWANLVTVSLCLAIYWKAYPLSGSLKWEWRWVSWANLVLCLVFYQLSICKRHYSGSNKWSGSNFVNIWNKRWVCLLTSSELINLISWSFGKTKKHLSS